MKPELDSARLVAAQLALEVFPRIGDSTRVLTYEEVDEKLGIADPFPKTVILRWRKQYAAILCGEGICPLPGPAECYLRSQAGSFHEG